MKMNITGKMMFRVALFTLVTATSVITMSSCGDDYDDSSIRQEISDLDQRVSDLEKWQTTVNSEISSLQSLITSLQSNDYIKSVSTLTENGEETGYSITFASGKTITIKNGKDGADGADGTDGTDGNDGEKGDKGDKGDTGDKGDKGDTGDAGEDGHTPVIGVKLIDGVYYWTVDGELLLDDNGQKMPVTGKDGADGEDGKDGTNGTNGKDAVAPQVRINTTTNIWEISKDGGKTWESTGIKATGNDGTSIYDKVEVDNNANTVTISLTSGSSITIPLADLISVSYADGADVFNVSDLGNTCTVVFTGLTESNYTGVAVELRGSDGTSIDVQTRATSEVSISKPTLVNGKYQSTVTFNTTYKDSEMNKILKVTVIGTDGKEYSASRIAHFPASKDENSLTTDVKITTDKTMDSELKVLAGTQTLTVASGATLTAKEAQVRTIDVYASTENVTLNITGDGTIKAPSNPDEGMFNGNSAAIRVKGNATYSPTVNISGDIKVYGSEQVYYDTDQYIRYVSPAIYIASGTVNISGGYFCSYTYESGYYSPCICMDGAYYEYDGERGKTYLNISGGVFDTSGKSDAGEGKYPFLISFYSTSWGSIYPNRCYTDNCTVTITGGIFVGFNPATDDKAGVIKVADGYTVKETTYNGKNAYEVVKE